MDVLNQSSLPVMLQHNTEHDCAILTAYRGDIETSENKKRNIVLAKALKRYGYDTTAVDGIYQEEGKDHPTKEVSFFVVNVNDDSSFKKNCCDLAEEFEQDSIAYIPKGVLSGKNKPYLIGTKPDAVQLKYGETLTFSETNFGKDAAFKTTIDGKPFNFTFNESIKNEEILSYAYNKRGLFTAMLVEQEFKNRAPKTFKQFIDMKKNG